LGYGEQNREREKRFNYLSEKEKIGEGGVKGGCSGEELSEGKDQPVVTTKGFSQKHSETRKNEKEKNF